MTVVHRTKKEMNAMDKGDREEFLTIEDKIARARSWVHFDAARLLSRLDEAEKSAQETLLKHQADVGTFPTYAMENADRAMVAAAMLHYHQVVAHPRGMLIKRDLQIALDNPTDARATIVLANGMRALYAETISYANNALSGGTSSSGCTREMSAKKVAYALRLTGSATDVGSAYLAANKFIDLFLERAAG